MKTPRIRLALFVAAALFQVIAVGWTIYGYEKTLRQGDVVEFQVRPVDPYDPFRGRYVRLALSPTVMELPAPNWKVPSRGESVYVTLGRAPDGLAVLESVSYRPPHDTDRYLKVHVWPTVRRLGGGDGDDNQALRIVIPFDRYYLNEDVAPEAERLIWPRRGSNGAIEEEPTARLVVRVHRGRGVPEALLLDGHPVEEVAAERLRQASAPGHDPRLR